MAITEDLLIKVQADTKNAVASLGLMNHSLEAIQDSLKIVAQTSQRTEKSITGFGGAVVKINQALELSKKVFAGLVGPVTKMVGDFLKAEDASRQFAKTLSILGDKDVAGTVTRFQELADQLEETTNVEAESILGLAKLGASAGLTNNQIEKFIKTSIDMAGALGTDVDQAFNKLLLTMKGQERSLGPLANLLSGLSDAELRAGKAADVLGERLSGMGKSLGPIGEIKATMINLGNIAEELGEIISKGLDLEGSTASLNSFLRSIKNEIESIKPSAIEAVTTVRAVFVGLSEAIKAINFGALLDQLESFIGLVLRAGVAIGALALAMNAQAFGTFLISISSSAGAMVKLGMATAVTTAKFALMATAITTAVVALDFLVANVEKLPQALLAGFSVVTTGLLSIWEKTFRAIGLDSLADKVGAEADKIAKSAVNLSEDLKPGLLIEGFNQATAALGGFKAGFDQTTDSAKDFGKELEFANGKGRKTLDTLKTMSEEGKKTFDELVKKVGELKKELDDIGAGEGQKIQNNLNARMQEIALIEQKLVKENSLSKAAQDQLKIARDTAQAIATAQTKDLRKKNLEEQVKLYKDVQNQIKDIDATTVDRINMQKQADLEEISKRREKLMLDKELNKEALAQLDLTEEQIKLRAEMLAAKAPDADFEAAQMAGGNLGNQVAKAFQGPISGMLAGAGAFADAIQGLIDFIPQMLDKITGIFTSLTELPMKILEGVSKLGDALLKFVADFIPNVLSMVPKLLEKFIEFFANLPDVFANLLAGLPDMLTGLLDRLPDLVENFVEKLIQATPKIVVSLINFLIKKGPYIAVELAKALAIEIPMAIINGILDAIKSLPKMFKELGKGIIPKPSEIAKNFALGLKTVTKTLTGVASKLFAVVDLEEGAKAGGDKLAEFAKTAEDAVNDNIEKLGKGAGDAWQGLIDAWRWVYDNIILPIFNGIKAVWSFVYDFIIKPLLAGLREVWLFVYNTIILPFIDLLKTAWSAMIKVFEASWAIVQTIWDSMMKVLSSVWDTLMVVFQSVWNVAKSIWDAMMSIFTSAWDMVKNIWNVLMDLFQGKINIFDAVFKIGAEIFNHVAEVFRAVWGVGKVALEGVANIFGSVFETARVYLKGAADVFLSVFSYIKTVFDGLVSIGDKIWNNLKKAFSGIGSVIANAINAINPSALFEKIFRIPSNAFGDKGAVERALGIDMPFLSFARGGKVPGSATVSGDSVLNDKILALLSPGEVVIPRSAMSDPVTKKLIESILQDKALPQFGLGGLVESGKKYIQEKTSPVAEALGKVFPDFDPASLWKQVADQISKVVMKIFESNRFHNGGEVPAMLKPGEFVMNNGAVDRVGTGFLESLNRGGNGGQAPVINNTINLTINTTQPMDEAFIKNKVYPVVKEQIKRASIDGQTLVYAPGVRSA
jgi:hypothetical protein